MTVRERAIAAVDFAWTKPIQGKSAHTTMVDAVDLAIRAAVLSERAACAKAAIGAGKEVDLSEGDARHIANVIMDRSRFD